MTQKEIIKAGETRDIVLVLENETDVEKVFEAEVEKDAVVNWYVAVLGGSNLDLRVQSHILGEGGESNIKMIFVGSGSDTHSIFAGNIFDAPNCRGEIFARGVVADKAKSSFIGEIDITLEGGGTDSYLKEEVLMLDETARVDAIPSLEIKTNDVKAGHGVSISRLTDERLFYLMSRGLSREKARELVLDGFLRSVYNEFGDEVLIKRISEYLEGSYA
jgi:Fe-S cluster assembly scaffold protein SufB